VAEPRRLLDRPIGRLLIGGAADAEQIMFGERHGGIAVAGGAGFKLGEVAHRRASCRARR
jgi:hypothetical protein